MSSEQVAAIERLRELEKKATHGQWFTDPEFEESLTAMVKSNECEDLIFGACDWPDADLICALRNDGLPLIEALQQSLSEAQADARVFSNSYSALAEDFGRLKEENERLRDLIKDACTDLGRMTLLRDKFYCEMETAQTETVFAKKEIERLRAGIGRALENLKDADAIGLRSDLRKAMNELEALHDA